MVCKNVLYHSMITCMDNNKERTMTSALSCGHAAWLSYQNATALLGRTLNDFSIQIVMMRVGQLHND